MLAPGALRNAVRLLTALAVMLSGLSGLRAAPAFHESGAVQAVEAAAERPSLLRTIISRTRILTTPISTADNGRAIRMSTRTIRMSRSAFRRP
jgi:hypothetical protein